MTTTNLERAGEVRQLGCYTLIRLLSIDIDILTRLVTRWMKML